jgi:DNA-binding response OmpR family regulator
MILPKKILIVSRDNELYRRLNNHLFESGYKAKTTRETGSELKPIIDELAPDLIIVNPETPSLQGLEISLLIRQWTPVPILILTTDDTRESEVRTLDLSAKDYLSEPFAVGVVAARINKILSMSTSILEN